MSYDRITNARQWTLRSDHFMHQRVVTVYVGPSTIPFKVPRALLCRHSKFFDAALSGDRWSESETNDIILTEDDPTIFNTFLDWLYGGDVDIPRLDNQSDINHAVMLYVLADRIQSTLCKNHIIGKVLDVVEDLHSMSPETCAAIAILTSDSDGLKLLLMDWIVSRSDLDQLPSLIPSLGPGFTAQLVRRASAWRRKISMMVITRSDAHLDALVEEFHEVEAYTTPED